MGKGKGKSLGMDKDSNSRSRLYNAGIQRRSAGILGCWRLPWVSVSWSLSVESQRSLFPLSSWRGVRMDTEGDGEDKGEAKERTARLCL